MPRTVAAGFLAILLIAGTLHTAAAGWKESGFGGGDDSDSIENIPRPFAIQIKYRDSAGNVCFPVDGNGFGLLVAGRPDMPLVVYQSVHSTAGEALSATLTFKAFDGARIKDWAAVRVYNAQTEDDDHRYRVESSAVSEDPSQAEVGAVPVPPSLSLLGAGLLAVFAIRERRLRKE